MRRKQPAQFLLLVALVVTIGGATLASPLASQASGTLVISDLRSNMAVKALIRADLIRTEIVTLNSGVVGDNRVDRGVVRQLRGRLLTLAERDGTIVKVKLSSATQIRIDGRKAAATRVQRGMRTTVFRMGNSAVSWLYVTRTLPDTSLSKVRALLSAGFVRTEVISWTGGALLDSRADTGVIDSSDGTSMTLLEADGTSVPMQFDAALAVWVNNRVSGTVDLAAGMRVTTIGNGDGVVSQVWAYGKRPVAGRK
jgi:hypothetical protein